MSFLLLLVTPVAAVAQSQPAGRLFVEGGVLSARQSTDRAGAQFDFTPSVTVGASIDVRLHPRADLSIGGLVGRRHFTDSGQLIGTVTYNSWLVDAPFAVQFRVAGDGGVHGPSAFVFGGTDLEFARNRRSAAHDPSLFPSRDYDLTDPGLLQTMIVAGARVTAGRVAVTGRWMQGLRNVEEDPGKGTVTKLRGFSVTAGIRIR